MKTVKEDYKEVEGLVKDGTLCLRNGDVNFDKYNREYKKRRLKQIQVESWEAPALRKFLREQGVPAENYHFDSMCDGMVVRVKKRADAGWPDN